MACIKAQKVTERKLLSTESPYFLYTEKVQMGTKNLFAEIPPV